ncbi:MAG: hypothetical protein ACK4MV_09085 [Beijerinckiaceae bacterium]
MRPARGLAQQQPRPEVETTGDPIGDPTGGAGAGARRDLAPVTMGWRPAFTTERA